MPDIDTNTANVLDEPEQSPNAKKRVLLSFVRQRDPYNKTPDGSKTEGSILTICAEIIPDIVYLFPSPNIFPDGELSKSATETNARDVESIYKSLDPNCQFMIKILNIKDVTDGYSTVRQANRNCSTHGMTEFTKFGPNLQISRSN
jgi:hypothetical protein